MGYLLDKNMSIRKVINLPTCIKGVFCYHHVSLLNHEGYNAGQVGKKEAHVHEVNHGGK